VLRLWGYRKKKGRGSRAGRRNSRPPAIESILMPSTNIWRQWDDEYDTGIEETEYFAANTSVTNRHMHATTTPMKEPASVTPLTPTSTSGRSLVILSTPPPPPLQCNPLSCV
jgi:hypothetical protein